MQALSDAQLQSIRDLAKRDLFFFAKGVLGYSYLDIDIHGPICRLLEDHAKTRVQIELPRGWYKTTLVSISFLVWLAINNPNIRTCLVQNTITNAVAKLRAIDDIFKKNELFRALFPELLPDKTCVWRTDSMCVRRDKAAVESTFEAAGTRTAVISRHYDVIVEDDTVAPDLDQLTADTVTPSQDDIEQAIGFHRLATFLLADQRESRIIVVGTRWYERDLLIWIRQTQKGYEYYSRACRELDPTSGELKPTFPARYGEEELDRVKQDVGPYLFSCLYMNQPIHAEDMVFQKEWFRRWTDLPSRDELEFYTTVDPAGDPDLSKRKNARKKTDWNVVTTTAKNRRTGQYFVVEISKRKCNPSELIDMLFQHVREYKPKKVGIETVGYQQSLVHWIKERMALESLYFYIEPLTHGNTAKNVRIQGLQPLVYSGKLLFGQSHNDLIAELEAFPLAAHDDLSDCLAMHLQLWAISLREDNARDTRPTPEVPEMVAELRADREEQANERLHSDIYAELFEERKLWEDQYAFN